MNSKVDEPIEEPQPYSEVIKRIKRDKSEVKKRQMAESKRKQTKEKEEAMARLQKMEEDEQEKLQKHQQLQQKISRPVQLILRWEEENAQDETNQPDTRYLSCLFLITTALY